MKEHRQNRVIAKIRRNTSICLENLTLDGKEEFVALDCFPRVPSYLEVASEAMIEIVESTLGKSGIVTLHHVFPKVEGGIVVQPEIVFLTDYEMISKREKTINEKLISFLIELSGDGFFVHQIILGSKLTSRK